MLYFILTIVLLVTACGFLIFAGNGRAITPTGCIGFSVFVFYVFKLIWNLIFGVDYLFNFKPEELAGPFLLLAGILIFTLMMSWSGLQKYNFCFAHPQAVSRVTSSLKLKTIFWLFYFILPISALLLGKLYLGVWSWNAAIEFRAYIQSGGMMYLYMTIAFFAQVGFIVLSRAIFIEKKMPPIPLMIGLPGMMLYALNTGFTSTPISFIFPAVLYLTLRKGWRLEWLLPVVVPLAGFWAMTHLLYKRSAVTREVDSISQAVTMIKSNPDWDYGFMNRLDYPEQYALSVRHTLLEKGPDWGTNMMGFFAQPIPRGLWPNKPITFSAYMTRELQPENYYAGISANFGGIAELINAFGILGPIVAIIVLSFYIRYSARHFHKACFSDAHFVVYYFIFYQLIMGSLLGAFVNDLSIFTIFINLMLIKLFIVTDDVMLRSGVRNNNEMERAGVSKYRLRLS